MKHKIFKPLYLLLVFISLLMVRCQANNSSPKPPNIEYGQDVCDQCGMIISDSRFSAGLELLNGNYLKFDDVGEMLLFQHDHPEDQVKNWWVHDYISEKWIRGEEAYIVRTISLTTPMANGVVAFRDQQSAEEFAAENNGLLYTLDEIRAQIHLDIYEP